jgi:hypothetical protein
VLPALDATIGLGGDDALATLKAALSAATAATQK